MIWGNCEPQLTGEASSPQFHTPTFVQELWNGRRPTLLIQSCKGLCLFPELPNEAFVQMTCTVLQLWQSMIRDHMISSPLDFKGSCDLYLSVSVLMWTGSSGLRLASPIRTIPVDSCSLLDTVDYETSETLSSDTVTKHGMYHSTPL